MVATVLQELVSQHENVEITMVSNHHFESLFTIERVSFYGINLANYKGIFGLWKLAQELGKLKSFDAIADLHNVIRSKIIRFLFPQRIPSAVIDKGRKEKKQLTRKTNKNLYPLTHNTERYAKVFAKLKLPIALNHQLVKTSRSLPSVMTNLLSSDSKAIGIAPFAQHQAKQMPILKTEELIHQLSTTTDANLLLFGASGKEQQILETFASKYHNTYSMAGKFSLAEELDIISHLQVMLSMDSANMHLASLVGTPVISVWTATHPYAGFLGYGQSMNHVIQSSIECRPCSVFGNKPCYRTDYACLQLIDINDIIKQINSFI